MSKGLKRICMNCGTRFYDLDKTPIVCPSCETEFTGDIKVKSRRGRPAATPEAPIKKIEEKTEIEDEVEEIDADDDVVSLDDMDDEDDGTVLVEDEDEEDADVAALDGNFDDVEDEEEDLDDDGEKN